MKKNKYIKLMAGAFMLTSITALTIGCGNINETSTENNSNQASDIDDKKETNKEKGERPDFENMTEEEKAEFEAKRGEKPDFDNMTEEEKAEFESKRGQKPDFENMTEEEKAEFEAKKGEKPDFNKNKDIENDNKSE